MLVTPGNALDERCQGGALFRGSNKTPDMNFAIDNYGLRSPKSVQDRTAN